MELTAISSILKTIILTGSLLMNNTADNFIEFNQKINNQTRRIEIKKIYSNIPMDSDHLIHLINLAYEYQIDPDFILAIIWTESNFNPNAKNKNSSARGYGQFIKSTAILLADEIPYIETYDHNIDGYDPYINIHMMCLYLNKLINMYNGDIQKVLLSYRGEYDKDYFDKVYKRMEIIKKRKIKLQ